MRKYFFIFLLFLSFVPCAFAVGCVSDYELEINANAPIMIGENEYYSLAEAIAKADDGDAILVFDDVAESRNNEYVKPLTSAVVAGDVYVAYEINKPLVIKGVGNGSNQPKINGSFLINLSDQNYLENSVTIDNLEIVHGYMNIDNNVVNEKFAVGVRVFDGSANVVNNYMHTISHVDDEQIQKNNLPLTYGLMLSRPLESDMMGGVLRYDITGNRFGEYHNNKDYAFSSPVSIIEMHEDLGNFAPAILNTKSS
ncbi:MAG: hypothetical protein IJW24_03660, partial [Clostridia bacterium]|nr:hypothetical protein [Clostridia bacterium]